MVSVEELESLDIQMWVRSGEEASSRLNCSQSTVSRRNNDVLDLFTLRMERDNLSEWILRGDSTLLRMERNVHQFYRFNHHQAKLRLEATFWAGPTLTDPAPEGWLNGIWDHFGMERPLYLLRERIIDAWIGSYQPDLPDKDDPEFCVIDLCYTPVKLVADAKHPLMQCKEISSEDLESFPSLSLSSGLFPHTEKHLKSHGLWNTESRMKKYKKAYWENKTEDQVTLCYATCLGLEVMKNLSVLNYDLGLMSGESLVVRRDLVDEVRIQELLSCLKKRVLLKAKVHKDLIPASP